MIENLTKSVFLEKIFNFEEEDSWNFNKELPVLIDFYADWCGPCKTLAPVLEQLSIEYEGKINIYKVNTEKEPELSTAFGIRSIPSMLFCPIGEQPQMANGVLPKQQIEQIIKEVLKIS